MKEKTLIEKTVNIPGLVSDVKKKIKEKKEDTKAVRIMKIILIVVLIGSICILWARFISTRGLRVREVKVESNKLPSEYDGLKMIQFTDLHYGGTIFEKELENIISTINKQKPDIVVFTGDLVDMDVVLTQNEFDKLVELFNKIEATTELYIVKGNHDYDHSYFDELVPKTNFKLLNNTYDYFYKDSNVPIVFVGLDDLRDGKPNYDNAFSYLKETNDSLFTIVLQHEPDQILKYKNKYKDFDIVLAGHSHLGQVRLPFIGAIWTPEGSKKYYDEHYKVDGKDLYIDGGVGTSMMKLRFFNKPTITLYRFYAN